jgi:hypothetical protein
MLPVIHVFSCGTAVPTRNDWQSAINDLGCKIVLPQTIEISDKRSIVRVDYDGEAVEFDVCREPAIGVVAMHGRATYYIANRDNCFTFRFERGCMQYGAVLASAATLTKLVHGIYFDSQDEYELLDGNEAFEMAQAALG